MCIEWLWFAGTILGDGEAVVNKADKIFDFLELNKLQYVRHYAFSVIHKMTGIHMSQAHIELIFGKMNDIFYVLLIRSELGVIS